MTKRIVHADGLVIADGAPLCDGAVVVDAEGTIHDVGPAGDLLPCHAGLAIERVRGVVFPGLVNAHAHVELSALRGQVKGGNGFIPWVRNMLGARFEASPEQDLPAIEAAVEELDAFGTSAIGDVTNTLAAVPALGKRGLAGSTFHEVFGLDPRALEARVAGLEADRAAVGPWPEDLAYVPSPHTLYTTVGDVVRKLVDNARKQGKRASLHLAEHAAERRVLETGDGPAADWFEAQLKIPRASLQVPRKGPIAYAEDLGALGPHVLLVHLTDARPEELEVIARANAPVVLCPRSNLFIEVRLPPLLTMRALGIAPALGTDSIASNTSLDVLAEARALADRFVGVPPQELLQMATWNGARALGREDLGRIVKGARPGLVAIDGDPGRDPCAFVLRHVSAPRRWVARRSRGARA